MKKICLSLLLALLTAPVFAEDVKQADPAPVAETQPAAEASPAAEAAKPEAEAKPVNVKPVEIKPMDTTAAPDVDQKREGKMRDRWRKMTPDQREEMRKKAARRLQERFERLNPQEQAQINNMLADIEKLGKEQKSILLAKFYEKRYKERQQKMRMKELEGMKPKAQ